MWIATIAPNVASASNQVDAGIVLSNRVQFPPAGLQLTCDADQPLKQTVAEITGHPLDGASDHVHAATRVAMLPAAGNPQQRWGRTYHRYSVELRDLKAAHRYRYRCGDGERWSGWKEHETIYAVESYPPSRRPDRVILTWSGDTTSTQSVTWRTDSSVTNPVAEVAPAGPGPDFAMKATRIGAASERLSTPEHGEVRYHSAVFSSLKADTLYTYRVGEQGGLWSEWFQFRTASAQPKPFSFLYFGDAQNSIRSQVSRVFRQAALDAPRARFMVHAGDLVTSGASDAEWGQWHGAASWLNGMIPSVPVVGNHEMSMRKGGGRDLTPHWRPQFTLPTNGPEGLIEEAFYFDFQDMRFIVLNSVDAEGDSMEPGIPEFGEKQAVRQAKWLENLLRDNPNRWTVLSMHYPVISTFGPYGNERTRAIRHWKPLIDRYRVDLVLQGHEHTYARMRVHPAVLPPTKFGPEVHNEAEGARWYDGDAGTVYVTSVAGPKMYTIEDRITGVVPRIGEGIQLYQVIHVDGDRLGYEAKTADGRLYDAFDLVKQGARDEGRPNRLIEKHENAPSIIATSVPAVDPSRYMRLGAEKLQAFVGTYGFFDERNALPEVSFSVSRDGDQLFIDWAAEDLIPVFAVSNNEFVGTYPGRDPRYLGSNPDFSGEPLRLTFLLDQNGNPVRVSFVVGRTTAKVADRIGRLNAQ